jgi:hypothetical protein
MLKALHQPQYGCEGAMQSHCCLWDSRIRSWWALLLSCEYALNLPQRKPRCHGSCSEHKIWAEVQSRQLSLSKASAPTIGRFYFPKPEAGSLTDNHTKLYTECAKVRRLDARSCTSSEGVMEVIELLQENCAVASPELQGVVEAQRLSFSGFRSV